jgi:hypothetical protein
MAPDLLRTEKLTRHFGTVLAAGLALEPASEVLGQRPPR